MKWNKIGRIFCPRNFNKWMQTHAAVPNAIPVDGDKFRIVFSSRDKNNRSYPCWIEVNINNPLKILKTSPKPILIPEKNKLYDKDGIMPTCFIEDKMYYIGWNSTQTRNNVPFQNSIGLALENDKEGYKKHPHNPIISFESTGLEFVASSWVIKEKSIFKMWYLACSEWKKTNQNTWQHKYNIHYSESTNGIEWGMGKVAIDFLYPNEYAISRPVVIKENKMYKMWYSYRGGPLSELYRIGYAESKDGISWERMDHKVGINVSDDGWDNEMIEYPFVFDHKGNRYMLYNGNGYGKTGFGIAILEKD